MRAIRKLILIAHGTYNARKFWTRRTSSSVRGQTIAWKYAYRISRYSGNPMHLVVMHVRSSTRDRSLRIDYWTLNSRNVNSTFAASGRFSHSRSHLFTINKLMPERVCTCACACVRACHGVCVCMRVDEWVSEWGGGARGMGMEGKEVISWYQERPLETKGDYQRPAETTDWVLLTGY